MNTYLDRVKKSKLRKHTKKWGWKNILIGIVSVCFVGLGILCIWLANLKIPDLSSFDARETQQSTKIYDRTGTILLYDAYQGEKRTVVSFDQISPYIKDATLSIEDKDFYHHGGIVISSIIRSILVDITSLSLSQGGSTITQQVVKNDILTNDKTPERKLKEWILSEKLEKIMTKDEIFNLYLNDIPYGGSNYGVEEASESYFGIHASDVDIAQAAYLAAMPQAPSYYSPYGPNKAALDARKNLVLKEMLNNGYITATQYASSTAETVTFLPQEDMGIKAPHFVQFVENYLEQKYGGSVMQTGGLKVITTLDYPMEEDAEAVALKYATSNQKTFNASNDAFVALDPKTGQILTMVGSRNFFDTQIDGQFNVTTADRQPGSTFKPFVYAQAFNEGYTPDTVLFDVPTQFSTSCAVNNFTNTNGCYAPGNYDNQFRGPMTLRDALAQSINVPSVKVMYLAGVQNSINLATSMGVTSLGGASQYGLTLVLGGAEVSLLDMTSAYGVFADNGVRNPYTAILEVDDANGNVLEKYTPNPSQVLNPQSAEEISDILSDDVARTPLYGAHSALYFPGYDVAVKTGTTNDSRDAWSIGYTPDLVVGTWAGNNDDTPMTPNLSGLIVVPMWSAFMNEIINQYPDDQFVKPQEDDSYALKPVLRGEWQGGISTLTYDGSVISTTTAATLPYDSIQEMLSGGVHSILYWLDKDDPRGPETPGESSTDPQFKSWEYGVTLWAQQHGDQ